MKSKHYRAFISYSQQDGAWGKRIHAWLESYRVPMGAVADITLPRRLGRFFRDEDEMAAASDIAETVRGAIEDSESLIVICSPRSAQSKWVNAEIHHFRRTGRARNVFAVIIDGVPNSGDPATECFPPALRAQGDPDDPDALPIEPVGLDIRKEGRRKACARLAAGLLGIAFDDLWRRERRRAQRQALFAGAGAVAVAAAFAGLAMATLSANNAAGRRAALLNVDAAREVASLGDVDGALLLLLDAAQRFNNDASPVELLAAFDDVLQRAVAETVHVLPAEARIFDARDGVFIADPAARTLALLTAEGPPKVLGAAASPLVFAGQASDGSLIVVGEDNVIQRWGEGRVETLGAFAAHAPFIDRDDPYEGRFRNPAITLSDDDVLLLQPGNVDGVGTTAQLFDLNAGTLRAVEAPEAAFRHVYSRAQDGRRRLLSCCDVRQGAYVLDLDGEASEPAPSPLALMTEHCARGVASDGVARALSEAAPRLYVLECWRDGADVLIASLEATARAPERAFRLVSAAGQGAIAVRDDLAPDLANPAASFVAGPLVGAYAREYEIVRLQGRALAAASENALLVRVREESGPPTLYEWVLPDVIAYVRFLSDTTVAAIDQSGDSIRVFDFSTDHPYAARRVAAERAEGADRPDDRLREDPLGRFVIEEADLGDGAVGAVLVSRDGATPFRRLDVDFVWSDAGFSADGEVVFSRRGEEIVFTPHDLDAATAAARRALSARCLGFQADRFTASPCWPAAPADAG